MPCVDSALIHYYEQNVAHVRYPRPDGARVSGLSITQIVRAARGRDFDGEMGLAGLVIPDSLTRSGAPGVGLRALYYRRKIEQIERQRLTVERWGL